MAYIMLIMDCSDQSPIMLWFVVKQQTESLQLIRSKLYDRIPYQIEGLDKIHNNVACQTVVKLAVRWVVHQNIDNNSKILLMQSLTG